MKSNLLILPYGRRISPEIVDMPFKGKECDICDLVFTDMTSEEDYQRHMYGCVEKKAEENKKMIALGYKQTSKGWIMQ